jgi:FtsZ-interacting cell division protein ZipA
LEGIIIVVVVIIIIIIVVVGDWKVTIKRDKKAVSKSSIRES